MKTSQAVLMINDGWNLNEIRDLMKKSLEMEKQFVRNVQYDNRYKITDFKGIKKYYCMKHNCFHNKYRKTTINGKKEKVKTTSFERCKKHAYQLSDSELFKRSFKKSCNTYSIKSHKKTRGSRK